MSELLQQRIVEELQNPFVLIRPTAGFHKPMVFRWINRKFPVVLSQFNPEELIAAAHESVRRRLIVKEALARNDTHWDFSPHFDATRQYVR